jgi:DNA repair protein RecO (recombination protein O)
MCAAHKRLASSEMSAESRALAAEMFRSPVESFAGAPWPRQRARDLRRFLEQRIERHIEKKLVTAAMLERIEQ